LAVRVLLLEEKFKELIERDEVFFQIQFHNYLVKYEEITRIQNISIVSMKRLILAFTGTSTFANGLSQMQGGFFGYFYPVHASHINFTFSY